MGASLQAGEGEMTTDEIMALADTYADGPHTQGYFGAHRESLRAAIEALQADARPNVVWNAPCGMEVVSIGDCTLELNRGDKKIVQLPIRRGLVTSICGVVRELDP
jgi:hypothetical protein